MNHTPNRCLSVPAACLNGRSPKNRLPGHCRAASAGEAYSSKSILLAVALLLAPCAATFGQAFNYGSFNDSILSANLAIDFAGMTANRYVGGIQVNSLQLWDPASGAS